MLMAIALRLTDPAMRRLLMLLLRCLLGSQNGVQRIAFLSRPKLYDASFADVFNQAFQNLASQIGACHLATAKENRGFNFVSLVEETQHVILLSLVIVIIHINAELHFLDHNYLLMFLGL